MPTTGQRIAAKRKELGLSQEALGEKLGVSRQSIYKWESDTSLPEVEKLVALSRLFSVSVGWLLGVEEDSKAPEKIIEEVLARCPPPKKSAWDKWSVRILFALCGAILGSVFTINARVRTIQNQYDALAAGYATIAAQMDSQFHSMTGRVEDALREQADLTADYGVKISDYNLFQNSVTFSVWAIPKTAAENTEVFFQAYSESGDTMVQLPARTEDGQTFRQDLTCPLSDYITISVLFAEEGGERQYQRLETCRELYQQSLPAFRIHKYMAGANDSGNWADCITVLEEEPTPVHIPAGRWTAFWSSPEDSKFGFLSSLSELKMGLFRSRDLVCWLDPAGVSAPSPNTGYVFSLPDTDLLLEPGDTLMIAAVYTDEYGRRGIAPLIPVYECRYGLNWFSLDSENGRALRRIENYSLDE